MTAQNKAVQLVNELFERSLSYNDSCIAAKFMTDEIIKELRLHKTDLSCRLNLKYWKEVKDEISKI